jgi:hypothetical protein
MTATSVAKRRPQVNVRVDWDTIPGYNKSMGQGLRRPLLSGNKRHICATIASLMLTPQMATIRNECQAIAILALYAGGALVTLTKAQFRRLERLALRYQSIVGDDDFTLSPHNWNFSCYVLKHARTRAKQDGVIPSNLTKHSSSGTQAAGAEADAFSQAALSYASWGDDGAFDPLLGQGLSSGFFNDNHADKLLVGMTIAMCALTARVQECEEARLVPSQALSIVALYAAGTNVTLSGDQFGLLCVYLQDLLNEVEVAPGVYELDYQRSLVIEMAHWAGEKANARARLEKID